MTKDITDNYIVLTPSEGYALTDGAVIAEYQVFLPLDGDDSVWHETEKETSCE